MNKGWVMSQSVSEFCQLFEKLIKTDGKLTTQMNDYGAISYCVLMTSSVKKNRSLCLTRSPS